MKNYNEAFNKAYSTLNAAQKAAVDTIDGPVMVVAGPGTGKTQLLAARIGKILKETDTQPQNILCLTFTDAGAIAMRKRLLEFIGPTAYNVSIYTYHGFANQIIQDNIENFGGYLELTKLSDLEEIDVYIRIIDAFANDHTLKRFKGDLYYEKTRLKNLFKIMKQEGWTPEIIEAEIEKSKQLMLEDEKYRYKRKYTRNGVTKQAGDLKQNEIDKEVKKLEKLSAGANEFLNYKKELDRINRYDYNDMILWVIDKFTNDENLLLEYQEKFHYILVDEYQDTNGSQNNLIYKLADYWAEPNLFVVGDDDQSIYRFQGANMDNIVEFKEKYNPTIVILDRNYRSGQAILDKSTELIENNNERLVATDPNLTKILLESRETKSPGKINFIEYTNTVHEEKGIIDQIIQLQKENFPLNEVAIIYRKHSDVTDIIKYLQINGIPLNVKQKVNVLELPIIKQLVSVLNYINAENQRPFSGDHNLFEILHFSFFEISPREIGKISIALYKSDLKWRDAISSLEWLTNNKITNPESIIKVSENIERWISDVRNVTIQTLIEKILTESTLLDDVLTKSSHSTFLIQAVNTFFEYIKNEATNNPKLSLLNVVEIIEKLESNGLKIPFNKITHSKEGINFITAHSAKGLEFDKVFIIRATDKNWAQINNNRGAYAMPESLVPASEKSDIEDDRRLFFVAMTRAKNELNISYSASTTEGKALTASRFITEINDNQENIIKQNIEDDELIKYTADLLSFQKGTVKLIDNDLIDKVLIDYKMSVTHLNKYIKCPISFYYEAILRVPQARTAHLGYGNAIHSSLEKLFETIKNSPTMQVPVYEVFEKMYKESLEYFRQHFTKKEFDNYLQHGKNILKLYYDANHTSWSTPRKYELEYPVNNVEFRGIPIKGNIDKIVYHDDHFYVVDYKTGKYSPPKLAAADLEKEKEGGDYWRQIIFYKMLIDADPKFNQSMQYGKIDFVEPDDKNNYKYKDITPTVEDIEIVADQLKTAYESINNHEFSEGCGEKNCRWCNLVSNHLNPMQ